MRVRLVAGFALAMVVVLSGAGAFVFWRVQYALDARIDQDLSDRVGDLRIAAAGHAPSAALRLVGGQGRDAQLLTADGRVLATRPGRGGQTALLTPSQAETAAHHALRTERGGLFSPRGSHLRVLALPIDGADDDGRAAVAASAVGLDQRDEALRELLAQLGLANLIALGLASVVGYRLARAALDPVERYRTQAERITQGATGVRLDVPSGRSDEITRLGNTLNAMLTAQERAAQRQQQLVDDASHELRTPLSALAAEVDLALRRPRTTAELHSALRRIAADSQRLVALVDEMLTLSALGDSTPTAQAVLARPLLDAAALRAREQLADAQPARAVIVEPTGALVTHADPGLISRALGNLVDNAVRHGAGAITLTAAALAPRDGPGCVYRVHDQGTGIDAAFLPNAAERFRRGDSARTGRGSGLGLALVDAIAAAHHGQLRICASEAHHHQPTVDARLAAVECRHPRAGTTVSLLLPGGPSTQGRGTALAE